VKRFMIAPENQPLDVNFQHAEIGTTMLLEATKGGHLDIVKLLVEEGNADVNLEADLFSEGSPATIAKEKGFKEIETFLVEHGAEHFQSQGDFFRSPKSNNCAIL